MKKRYGDQVKTPAETSKLVADERELDHCLLKFLNFYLPKKQPIPLYKRWLKETHSLLHQHDMASRTFEESDLWKEWQEKREQWADNSNMNTRLDLLNVTLKALPDILSGTRRATDVMFPGGSTELVEKIYRGSEVSDFFGEFLADMVAAFSAKRGRGLRMLEIGAGTGGTSAKIFKRLKPFHANIQEYCYTDISKFLFKPCEKGIWSP